MTTIVNCYGGPGTGKSTSAAFLFYALKSRGANAELVREYVKEWAWEGRRIGTYDQLYFLGKQVRKESLLYGKVTEIITDCPVAMGAFYAQHGPADDVYQGVLGATKAFYRQGKLDGHRHLHVFLERTKKYNPSGRYQTEEQARDMDWRLRSFLTEVLELPLISCGTDEASLTRLVQDQILASPSPTS